MQQIMSIRNHVNNALAVLGPSGNETKASEYLIKEEGRCYAHAVCFAALTASRQPAWREVYNRHKAKGLSSTACMVILSRKIPYDTSGYFPYISLTAYSNACLQTLHSWPPA